MFLGKLAEELRGDFRGLSDVLRRCNAFQEVSEGASQALG